MNPASLEKVTRFFITLITRMVVLTKKQIKRSIIVS